MLDFASNLAKRVSPMIMTKIKDQNTNFQYHNQGGSILIFALQILAITMSITFMVSAVFIPKLRIVSDSLKSVNALFAADSALEWCIYINRDNPIPQPLPQPFMSNGSTSSIYYPASSTTLATCLSTETPMDHRAVGTYQNISRSLEIR